MKDFRGFTLVELLVVIAIIGILATLLLLQLGVARAKARDAKRIADVNQFRTSVELYYDDNGGNYPHVSPLTLNEIGKYLSVPKIPTDPLDTTLNYKYAYYTDASNKTLRYQIWTNLEQNNASAFAGSTHLNTNAGGDWPAVGVGDHVDASANPPPCTAAGSGPNAAVPNCIYDAGQK